MLERFVRGALERVSRHLPYREISGEKGVFLRKYLLYRTSQEKDSVRIHLHHFLRGDEDKEPHDHPWSWAVSLILVGGYTEERLIPKPISYIPFSRSGRLGFAMVKIPFKPFSINYIGLETKHRVTIPEGKDAWTLFISGPVVKSWGFYQCLAQGHDPSGYAEVYDYIPWRDKFVKRKTVQPEAQHNVMLEPDVNLKEAVLRIVSDAISDTGMSVVNTINNNALDLTSTYLRWMLEGYFGIEMAAVGSE